MKTRAVSGGLCVALLVLGGLVRSGGVQPTAPEPKAAPEAPPERPALARTMGTSRCAGPACHGQESPAKDQKIRRDEYRLWNTWDPHAYAYHALEGQAAQDIIRKLGDTGQKATAEPRCLVCHATPRLLAKEGGDEVRVHGVGCESCHGAAEHWLDRHHTEPLPDAQELEKLGMTYLREPLTLAHACVQCHAGAPARDGLPAQEVTHDLLAAGHPRLNFELTVYLANLPPHWNVAAKARERGPDFEARAWAAGQLATARTSLQLLADQAGRAAPWPEFAAHDCESCHAPLRPQTKSPGGTRFPMSRWPYALLPEVGADIPEATPDVKTICAQFKELQDVLERSGQDGGQVADKAAALDKSLAAWERALGQWKGEPVTLMKRVGRHDHDWNWEEAEQRYLALSALEQARSARTPDERHPRIQTHLRDLAENLAFPSSFSGPRDFSDERLSKYYAKIPEELEK